MLLLATTLRVSEYSWNKRFKTNPQNPNPNIHFAGFAISCANSLQSLGQRLAKLSGVICFIMLTEVSFAVNLKHGHLNYCSISFHSLEVIQKKASYFFFLRRFHKDYSCEAWKIKFFFMSLNSVILLILFFIHVASASVSLIIWLSLSFFLPPLHTQSISSPNFWAYVDNTF